jgi:hypothetical protein
MDFITLAAETDPRRMMRYLADVSGEDDDMGFIHSPQQAAAAAAAAAAGTSSYVPPIAADYEIGDRPVFSRTAEAELYMLATNFLVYVSLVIVTIVVAKIYFPEALERGSSSELVPDRIPHGSGVLKKSTTPMKTSKATMRWGNDTRFSIVERGREEDRDLLNRRPSFRTKFPSLEFHEKIPKSQVPKRLVFAHR